MKRYKFLSLFFILTIFAKDAVAQNFSTDVDPWNTYQWNKENFLANNQKIIKKPWFEWWYYKVVIPETGKSYFFTYGIINPWDQHKSLKGTKSYVMMGDFHLKNIVENQFKLEDFNASYQETYVSIKHNIATDKKISGQLIDDKNEIYSWDIDVKKLWSFNAEGWLLGTGVTDIEWYPAQASAVCSGSIISKQEKINFKNAPCYQDRNWGESFPKWWTWIVSNQFENHPETTLVVGGGRPTVKGKKSPFTGVYVGLKHQGMEYAFRPTDFNIVKSDIAFGRWNIKALNRKYYINIAANAPKEKFMDLQFMAPNGEIFHDYETLTGQVQVKLYRKLGLSYVLVHLLNSNHAGIEYGSRTEYNL